MIGIPDAIITGSHGSQLGAVSQVLQDQSVAVCSGLDYFTTNYDQGLDWYLERLRERPGTSPTFEIAGSYFVGACAGQPVAPRAAGVLGRVPLVIALRHPVDGLLLAWRHAVVGGRVAPTATIEDVLGARPEHDRLRLLAGATRRHAALTSFSTWFGDRLLCVSLEGLAVSGSRDQQRVVAALGLQRLGSIDLDDPPDASDERAPVDERTRDRILEMAQADMERVRDDFGIDHTVGAAVSRAPDA